MSSAKPSLELLRSLTDEHVLRAVMEHRRLTRTEIASLTGISKPTISDSVRRLTEAGLLVDTGERTTGRGRAGSYYSLSEHCGIALVCSITPNGVFGEAVDAFGHVLTRSHAALDRAAGPERAADALADVAGQAPSGVRCAVVSVADPVDRRTSRLVQLPDVPFLVGELDPVSVLSRAITGPVLVDNDVNWAARAERRGGCAEGVDDFVHLHLGEGLGCAVVSDGDVRRGHGGLSGEIAHLWTAGPDGASMPLTEVFAALGLRRDGSTAIDVETVLKVLGTDDAEAMRVRAALARAICGVLSAAVTLVDPEIAVLGGPWGTHPALLATVAEQFATCPRDVPIAAATVDDPEITGARAHAVDDLRALIIGG